MKKIIFVDDEPNILQGLKRMLRSMRKEYEMFFAEGGNEALKIMEVEDIDVVVSDMRMPGMDGAELLSKIQSRHPQTIRIMLTGQADEESVMRTVGVVHQFLAKPCDPTRLKEILQKTSALQDLLSNGKLKNIVSQIRSLPSLPTTFTELQKAVSDPEVTIDTVAAIVEKDVAMCAKVLQLVNSSFFGLFTSVDTPSRAVSLLGLDTIKALVLSVGIFSQVNAKENVHSTEKLFNHSVMVSKFAKKIAELESNDSSLISDSLLAGILHDIGKLIFMSQLPEEYTEVITTANHSSIQVTDAERGIVGCCHEDIGAYLAGLWGFNSDIVEAIGFAHRLNEYPIESFSPAIAVHVADCVYYKHKPDEVIGVVPVINNAILAELGLESRIEVWEETCEEMMRSIDE